MDSERRSTPSQLPTRAEALRRGAPKPAVTPVARMLPNPSNRGFTPGTVLAGRYRVIGLLGRGGMGEVYRADDIKLGTPVALKFLPPSVADDPLRRERFLSEVRTARQVAHPNVCRVFDIVETGADGGHRFLAMEYVDGEDLASLLLRIGRLPSDKALDIARQILRGAGCRARPRSPAPRPQARQRDARRPWPCPHHRFRPCGRVGCSGTRSGHVGHASLYGARTAGR